MKLKNLYVLDFSIIMNNYEADTMTSYTNCDVKCRDKYELIEKIENNKILHLIDLDDNNEYYVNGKYVTEFQLEEEN